MTFDGVTSDRMAEMQKEMEGNSERPENVPAKEIVVLHDPESDRSLVILFFESEDDYRRGDGTLNAMPTTDTPGQRRRSRNTRLRSAWPTSAVRLLPAGRGGAASTGAGRGRAAPRG